MSQISWLCFGTLTYLFDCQHFQSNKNIVWILLLAWKDWILLFYLSVSFCARVLCHTENVIYRQNDEKNALWRKVEIKRDKNWSWSAISKICKNLCFASFTFLGDENVSILARLDYLWRQYQMGCAEKSKLKHAAHCVWGYFRSGFFHSKLSSCINKIIIVCITGV